MPGSKCIILLLSFMILHVLFSVCEGGGSAAGRHSIEIEESVQ